MQWIKKPWIIGSIIGLVILLMVGGFFYMQFTAWERPIQADLQVEGDSFLIGDEIAVTLRVLTEPGYTVEMPELPIPEGVEVVKEETGLQKRQWRTLHFTDRYVLTTFEPGEYQLPEITIPFTTPAGEHQQIKIPARTLVVQSLLTAEATDIRDLKPLAKAPVNPVLLYTLLALLLLGVVAFFVIRHLKSKKRAGELVEVAPPLPAHVIAYQRLQELSLSDLIETGQIERYFTQLSGIVREYIENRFSVKAQEMTTQEFLNSALRKLNLQGEQQKVLQEFLCQSDLVKYARHIPAYDQIHEAYHTARRFVDETKEVEEVLTDVQEGGKVHAESHL